MQAVADQPADVTRWHFIHTNIPGTQIDYRLLDDVSSRLKVADAEALYNTKAWVGWTEYATMLLGSEKITVDHVTLSGLPPVKTQLQGVRAKQWLKSIPITVHMGVPSLIYISFGSRHNPTGAQRPCRVAFNVSSCLPGILNQASTMHFIVCDVLSGHSWLVPALNFLIFAVTCYLRGHGYDGPYPSYSSSLETAEEVEACIEEILHSPTTSFKKRGRLEMTLENIVQEIWQRTAAANALFVQGTEKSELIKNVLVGIELYNIVFDGNFALKEVQCEYFPSTNAWRLLNREFLLVVCKGIGDVILPKEMGCLCPYQSRDYRGILTCMIRDMQRASKRTPEEWVRYTSNDMRPISEVVGWQITGAPFAPCSSQTPGLQNETNLDGGCWSSSRLQQMRENKGVVQIMQATTPNQIPSQGAVRFGLPFRRVNNCGR
ncbi:hypothetical protein BDZ91DRAFT_728096 [Kalaharituber pfeilii]|nr:hypothetical protein BDZ91DRAFT_728096 [Kalaharituber pfeilii]